MLEQTSRFVWNRSDSWFGGFSGAEMDVDGRTLTLITDRGSLVVARLIRHGDRLIAVRLGRRTALKASDGLALPDIEGDAEDIAIGADGQAFISFERHHRVDRLTLSDGRLNQYVPAPDAGRLGLNSGLESLAIDSHGRLFTIPEKPPQGESSLPLSVLENGAWRRYRSVPRRGPFLPVSADFDDRDRLYLLERAFGPLGFRSRIRRFDLTSPGATETILLTTPPGRFDNLEAITAWRDTAGDVRLTLVSDDNFFPIQRTQVVEFRVTE